MPARSPALDVLVVCSGNLCRSPYLALRLGAELPGLRVGSAGLVAAVGEPPAPQIVAALAARGIACGGARARRLTPATVRGARLVLTATAQHRIAVVAGVPEAAERTFTVLEFARLADGRGGGLDATLAAVAGADDPGAGPGDDLADPYGGDDAAYARMIALADAAVDTIVAALRP